MGPEQDIRKDAQAIGRVGSTARMMVQLVKGSTTMWVIIVTRPMLAIPVAAGKHVDFGHVRVSVNHVPREMAQPSPAE